MNALKNRRATAIPGHDRLRFAGVLRSELIKLTSLRSTVGLLLAIIACGLAISIVLGVTAEGAGLPDER